MPNVERSPLCPYQTHCGAAAEIGPCERLTADCCAHTITCQRCGKRGSESWNLLVGAAHHEQQRGPVAPRREVWGA